VGCPIPHCVLGYPFSWVEVATLVRAIVIAVSLLAGERPLSPDKDKVLYWVKPPLPPVSGVDEGKFFGDRVVWRRAGGNPYKGGCHKQR